MTTSVLLLVLPMVLGCYGSTSIPAEIVGDSMAPLFCGTHLSQRCPNCDFTFVCRSGKDLSSVQCPNCGSPFTPQGRTLPADRVSVDSDSTPRRWDVVAFEHGGKRMVKRVVGLPGETVTMADGNVLIDGIVLIKPAEILEQTRQLVFDSKHRNPAARAQLIADHDADIEWTNFRHQQNYPHTDSLPVADWPPIQDNSSYNQNVGRRLNDVDELAVRLDLTLQHGATFKLQRSIRKATYLLTLSVDESSGRYAGALTSGIAERTFSGTFNTTAGRPFEASISFSNIDGRVTAGLNENVLVDVPTKFGRQPISEQVNAPYLKFGFNKPPLGSVARCRIWRDIHYFADAAPPKFQLPQSLERGAYFVLGDNVAVSRDSRHFGPIKKVIGTVQK